ncbi:hypothetical protein [Polyangium mundeleinium]|uniref:Uncharacterized protein n=1 Tax=Polyangium mundeleinium TaxID=2995306 RepID=A0ABT5EI60_9BACT|nr:hypothetical protein [Polyangium mundeleinium]MDC0741441.1 hypothetical protein [Polyangium mundeleinium]
MAEDEDKPFDGEVVVRASLERELRAQGRTSPLPPWLRYPEVPRYSIHWRMGGGESYMMAWWQWAEGRSAEEKTTYFREFAPIPVEWVDWVGMQIRDDPEDDESASFDDLLRKCGEVIAHLGLYDIEAWQAYLKADAMSE